MPMFDFIRGLFGRPREGNSADFLRAAGEAEQERPAEAAIINSCRDLFGPAPRSERPADRIELDPELEQSFVERGDELLRILQDQGRLLARGRVCWGQLVQANKILFDPDNQYTCPANVVYSTDPFFDGRLSLLTSMARGLFAQKGSGRADRELQEFVDAVTDEMARVLRREMPHSYTGGRCVCFATCFVQPAHLPGGHLTRPSFPVIVNPEETPSVMLLPSRYWPEDLVAHWRG
jgi:hypothetical protein